MPLKSVGDPGRITAKLFALKTRRSGAGVCEHIAKWPIYSLITGVNLGSLSPLRGFIHKLEGRNPGNVCIINVLGYQL